LEMEATDHSFFSTMLGQKLDEGMKGSMMDYTVASIVETPIMDVFHYNDKIVNKDDKPEMER
jgi:hypothetical protein